VVKKGKEQAHMGVGGGKTFTTSKNNAEKPGVSKAGYRKTGGMQKVVSSREAVPGIQGDRGDIGYWANPRELDEWKIIARWG